MIRLLGVAIWLCGLITIALAGDGTWRAVILPTAGVLLVLGLHFALRMEGDR